MGVMQLWLHNGTMQASNRLVKVDMTGKLLQSMEIDLPWPEVRAPYSCIFAEANDLHMPTID